MYLHNNRMVFWMLAYVMHALIVYLLFFMYLWDGFTVCKVPFYIDLLTSCSGKYCGIFICLSVFIGIICCILLQLAFAIAISNFENGMNILQNDKYIDLCWITHIITLISILNAILNNLHESWSCDLITKIW